MTLKVDRTVTTTLARFQRASLAVFLMASISALWRFIPSSKGTSGLQPSRNETAASTRATEVGTTHGPRMCSASATCSDATLVRT